MVTLLKKYKEQISYLFFGVCTTLVNLIVYWICTRLFHVDDMVSVVISWVLSVTFAYVTNKIWVFESKTTSVRELMKEFVSFYTCRGGTLVLEMVIMFIFVKQMHFPDMIVKIVANILVIIANYILSKIYIFKNADA